MADEKEKTMLVNGKKIIRFSDLTEEQCKKIAAQLVWQHFSNLFAQTQNERASKR